VSRTIRHWFILRFCLILMACGAVLGARSSNLQAGDIAVGLAGEGRFMSDEQGYINVRSMQIINSLADPRIESLGDAEAYVRHVARACGVQGPVLTGELLPRLAEGELATARDQSRLVSDDNVAEAFNFLSREFQVPHPQVLTGTDVLQFRTTMSAIYPHVFSPKGVGGSRPVQALITLHQLVFNGGVPDGAKKYAQKDPQPGSLKIDPSRTRVSLDTTTTPTVREYRALAIRYFAGLTPQKMQSLVGSITEIMALPERGGL
jgi:hypothetical protein